MSGRRLKVMVIVGTRPELIKLSRTLAEIEKQFTLVFVHTGQNYDYELNGIFFRDLGIRKPDYMLEAAQESAALTIANVIAKSDELMAQVKPDALLILGDTNSCLAAISAKRRKIPIFHMEAGNRCFDQRVPEEINRKILDHISDINLPYTEHARRYLLAEGLRPETVIKTGSPMREILEYHRAGIEQSDVLARLKLQAGRYFVASAHREDNVDDPALLVKLLETLNALVAVYDLPLIFSTHARTRKRLDALDGNLKLDPRIEFMKPLGFIDYVHLQGKAKCVLSDSGSVTEEATILNFPAVTLRYTHERPEGMDEGTLIMCGLEAPAVLEAVRIVTAQHQPARAFRMVADYEPANVSQKVVRIIASYTDYVNRTVWHR